MSEYSILFFEHTRVAFNSTHVVWVSVLRVWAHQVSDFGDALLAVEYLLIHNLWLHFARMHIRFSTDNVGLHTTSIHQSLAVQSRN